jgi:hypothetical protein
MDHCRHCADPGDPRHGDPGYAKAERDCAYYENPQHLIPAGPGRRRRPRTTVTWRYEPPSCGPQTFTMGSGAGM